MDKQKVIFKDLGIIDYKTAWDYQENLLQENVRIKSAMRNATNPADGQTSILITANDLPTPDSRLPAPDSQLPAPDSQLPTPNSQLRLPTQLLTPNSQLPTHVSPQPTIFSSASIRLYILWAKAAKKNMCL
ncbi:MAG: hypothetical protein IPG38_15965 [Chitinophagaceae bacterium]|nr:hypothetical protein [Chitinophagaceae bacterium]